MTENPEHLRRRAKDARRGAEGESGSNSSIDRPADDLFRASRSRRDAEEDREATKRNHADWSGYAERLDVLRGNISEVLTARSTQAVAAEAHGGHSAYYAKSEHRAVAVDDFLVCVGRVTTFGADLPGRQQFRRFGHELMNATAGMRGGVTEYAKEIDVDSFDDAMGRIKTWPEPRTSIFADVSDRSGLLVASFGVQVPVRSEATEDKPAYHKSDAQVIHIGRDGDYHGHATTVFPDAYRPSSGMLGSFSLGNGPERLVTNEWAWPHKLGDGYALHNGINWQQYGTEYYPDRPSPERVKGVAVSGIELVSDFITGDTPDLERANQQLVDTLSRL